MTDNTKGIPGCIFPSQTADKPMTERNIMLDLIRRLLDLERWADLPPAGPLRQAVEDARELLAREDRDSVPIPAKPKRPETLGSILRDAVERMEAEDRKQQETKP